MTAHLFAVRPAPRASIAVARDQTLRVGILQNAVTAADSDAWRGITLGVEEAARTGALFGWRVALVPDGSTHDTAAVILASTAADCPRIAGLQDHVIFNLACTSADLRNPSRYPWIFHINPLAETAVVWDAGLERFGAAQLNERYRTRFSRGMTSAAWCGWFAVKVALEAAIRAQSAEPAAIRNALRSPDAKFDGHKGVALRFDAGQQLVQPVYSIVQGRVIDR